MSRIQVSGGLAPQMDVPTLTDVVEPSSLAVAGYQTERLAPVVGCNDGCGASVPEADLLGSGWEYLPIQKRYRCTACWRALRLVNQRTLALEAATA